MQTEREKLEEKISFCCETQESFINAHKTIIKQIERSIAQKIPETQIYFGKLEQIISDKSENPNKRFFATFLLKETVRRSKKIETKNAISKHFSEPFRQIEKNEINLTNFAEILENVIVFAEIGKDEGKMQLYQLIGETLREINNPKVEHFRFPLYIEDRIYADLPPEDISEGANAQLTAITALALSQKSANIFTVSIFGELNVKKLKYMYLLFRTNAAREQIEEAKHLMVSFYEANHSVFESALTQTVTEIQIEIMITLITFMNAIETAAKDFDRLTISELRLRIKSILEGSANQVETEIKESKKLSQNSPLDIDRLAAHTNNSSLQQQVIIAPQTSKFEPRKLRSNSPVVTVQSQHPNGLRSFSPAIPNTASAPHSRGMAPSPRDITALKAENKRLKERKYLLESEIAQSKLIEKESINEYSRSEPSSLFSVNADPQLLIEEIARKNREYDDLRKKYVRLLEEMSEKAANCLTSSRQDPIGIHATLKTNSRPDMKTSIYEHVSSDLRFSSVSENRLYYRN